MLENLVRNIRQLLPMTPEEQTHFLTHFENRPVAKGEIFLREGQRCGYVAYIDSGLVRYFRTDEAGREHTARFFCENDWVSDYAAFLLRGTAMISLEALEPTELYTLSYETVQKLYNEAKVFERFGRLMAENLFLENIDHSVTLLRKTPEERYLEMIRDKPDLMRRVPLKYVASMLGIEPESLSRIRKRMAVR